MGGPKKKLSTSIASLEVMCCGPQGSTCRRWVPCSTERTIPRLPLSAASTGSEATRARAAIRIDRENKTTFIIMNLHTSHFMYDVLGTEVVALSVLSIRVCP